MSTIDKQRISAVATLQALGYTYTPEHGWSTAAQIPSSQVISAADGMHALLLDRADTLVGCAETVDDGEELELIGAVVDAYELARWPNRKRDG